MKMWWRRLLPRSFMKVACISGYPNTRAASVVVKTLREWLEKDDYASEVSCSEKKEGRR